MNIADCYRWLGLSPQATLQEVKAAYRRLARCYHPDINPGNQGAHERFIQVTQAYKVLLQALGPAVAASPAARVTPPPLTPQEQQFKQQCYQQLQGFLQERRYARAVALVDSLASSLGQDPEVKQWQAIVYQGWGRYLASQGEYPKAKRYFKKALRSDPDNRSLCKEIEQDLQRLHPG